MNKSMCELIIWCLGIGASFGFYFLLLDFGYNNFDYCVTHICCATHNFGIQDQLWMGINLIPFLIFCTVTYRIILFSKTLLSLEGS